MRATNAAIAAVAVFLNITTGVVATVFGTEIASIDNPGSGFPRILGPRDLPVPFNRSEPAPISATDRVAQSTKPVEASPLTDLTTTLLKIVTLTTTAYPLPTDVADAAMTNASTTIPVNPVTMNVIPTAPFTSELGASYITKVNPLATQFSEICKVGSTTSCSKLYHQTIAAANTTFTPFLSFSATGLAVSSPTGSSGSADGSITSPGSIARTTSVSRTFDLRPAGATSLASVNTTVVQSGASNNTSGTTGLKHFAGTAVALFCVAFGFFYSS